MFIGRGSEYTTFWACTMLLTCILETLNRCLLATTMSAMSTATDIPKSTHSAVTQGEQSSPIIQHPQQSLPWLLQQQTFPYQQHSLSPQHMPDAHVSLAIFWFYTPLRMTPPRERRMPKASRPVNVLFLKRVLSQGTIIQLYRLLDLLPKAINFSNNIFPRLYRLQLSTNQSPNPVVVVGLGPIDHIVRVHDVLAIHIPHHYLGRVELVPLGHHYQSDEHRHRYSKEHPLSNHIPITVLPHQ